MALLQNFIQTKIYPHYTKLWVEKYRKLRQGDIVVDAGAYRGGFAIYAARKVGTKGKVISFEPDMNNFKFLSENVKKSGLTNIILVNKALGKNSGTIEMESAEHFSSSVIKKGNKPIYKVKQTTLDEELKRMKIKHVAVMKVNIEGAELGAIQGALQVLKNTDYIAISSHVVNGKHTAYVIEPTLVKVGFKTRIEKRIFQFTKHIDLYGLR